MTFEEIWKGCSEAVRRTEINPSFAVPVVLSPFDGVWWSNPTPDGYIATRNPLTGRTIWRNKDGRARSNGDEVRHG